MFDTWSDLLGSNTRLRAEGDGGEYLFMERCNNHKNHMKKDFDQWNEKKKSLHVSGREPFFHEREIWWCALGVNIGFEQDGGEEYRRPVVVLKGLSKRTSLIVPLTTSLNRHPLRIPIGLVEGEEASALLSQIRVVDSKRLVRKTETLEKRKFAEIKQGLQKLLFGTEKGKQFAPACAGARPKPLVEP